MKKTLLLAILLFTLGVSFVNGQYSVLVNFNGPNGRYPSGSLTLVGNKFYGMTGWGGGMTVVVFFQLIRMEADIRICSILMVQTVLWLVVH